MLTNMASEAIKKGVCLQLQYDGYNRVVEVHCVGVTTKGNPGIRVWQVRGGSQSDQTVGWKMLLLNEVASATLTDEKSQAPRQGYKRGDKGMKSIIFEI
ncbi:hypothetical protein [Bradyrhizobium australafricanum]|uniref:hypothetical protein n=1 Tax=Bradyrhizobium australafricanum TaxID=2821406 RepID=UPI001CE31284|nr:hypothetical protein [Bradyrhizobium australafricanum]MCA6103651.1 hypothetical protein [Bradyrhizobium australafricanum]